MQVDPPLNRTSDLTTDHGNKTAQPIQAACPDPVRPPKRDRRWQSGVPAGFQLWCGVMLGFHILIGMAGLSQAFTLSGRGKMRCGGEKHTALKAPGRWGQDQRGGEVPERRR